MSWEPIHPDKPTDSELIGDDPFDIIANAFEGRKNMAHTYTNLLTHMIFRTKDREPTLGPELKRRFFPYIAKQEEHRRNVSFKEETHRVLEKARNQIRRK